MFEDDDTESSSGTDAEYTDTRRSSNKLRKLLRNEMQWSEFSRTTNRFVPDGTVDRLINEMAVKTSMRIDKPSAEENELVAWILADAKKTFAIALLAGVNLNEAMRWLKRNNISDKDLPILKRTELWRQSWRLDFYEQQWTFTAPIFSTMRDIHNFEEAHILPFIEKLSAVGEGSFGEVSKYVLHKNHMLPALMDHTAFAVKYMKDSHDSVEVAEQWERDVKASRKMNELNQEHIVHFITAFQRGTRRAKEEQYLMFEWANGGNLRHLWRGMPTPALTGDLVKLVVHELLGLATALSAAHNLDSSSASYCHGNLKPENILVFKNGGPIGKLKIGGWGKFNSQRRTRRYEAPEVAFRIWETELGHPVERLSQFYDIWAMGCITLEFLVWLLYGLDGLNKFNCEVDGETFYHMRRENGRKVAQINSVALRWMDRMAQDFVCMSGNTAMGDLLKLVREDLLVVHLPRRFNTMTVDMVPIIGSENIVLFDLPEITVTPAEPQDQHEQFWIRKRSEKERTRCTASAFRKRMELMLSQGDLMGYWDVRRQQSQSPVAVPSQTGTAMSGLDSTKLEGTDSEEHNKSTGAQDLSPQTVLLPHKAEQDIEGSRDLLVGPQIDDDFATASTLKDPGSIRSSDSETLVVEGSVSNAGDDDLLDISSLASHETTDDERDGKSYIAQFLAGDAELYMLCKDILSQVNKTTFANTGRQILKTFYLGLLEDATTEREQESVRLLKSRRGRVRISEGIADIIISEEAQLTKERVEASDQVRMRDYRLERLLGRFAHESSKEEGPQLPESESWLPEDHGEHIASEEQANPVVQHDREDQKDPYKVYATNPDKQARSESRSESGKQPHLAEMEEFFRNSKSFQILLNGFRELLLPQSLKDIIMSASTDNIWISDRQNLSLINRMKASIEDYTMLRWNWWPLEPRMRTLKADETRLFWRCSCGIRLWKEISLDEAQLIEPMLLTLAKDVSWPLRCGRSKRQSSIWSRLVGNRGFVSSAASATKQNALVTNTGASNNAGQNTQTAGAGQQTPNLPGPSQQQQQGPSTASQPQSGVAVVGNIPTQEWILFCVQGSRRSLEVEHILIHDYVNDSSLYRSLREHYRTHRGKLRLWFSVWRFGYCEGMKFRKLASQFVTRAYRDLPEDFAEYRYEPHPPRATNPPIDHHEASMYLNCDNPCRWGILHDCVPELLHRHTINRVPKKRSKFEVDTQNSTEYEAWGLEAKHEISAAYVTFYHLLMLALPFGFWGWWQATHPDDLQNASVPVTVVLAMLSLFWGTNGILTQGRHSGENSI